jgi:hypothetical protein
MKKADLEKRKGKKIVGRMQQQAIPERFGPGAGEPADRREQRRREQSQGLVAFAVKLDQALVGRIQERARERGQPLNEVVDVLLRKALASPESD